MAGSRRAWGWHQLHPRWAERLVARSGVGPGDLVLDIGAGFGALTRPLVDAGAAVIAFERHPQRAATLRAEFGRAVTVVQADVNDLRLPRRPFHVVANPPFAATSAVLRRLIHPGSRLATATLILDERAISRWAGSAAPAAARWQQQFEIVLGERLPRNAFDPPPAVRCRVLALRRRELPVSPRRRNALYEYEPPLARTRTLAARARGAPDPVDEPVVQPPGAAG